MSNMLLPISGFVVVALCPGLPPTVTMSGEIYPSIADARRDVERLILLEDVLSGYHKRDISYSIATIGGKDDD